MNKKPWSIKYLKSQRTEDIKRKLKTKILRGGSKTQSWREKSPSDVPSLFDTYGYSDEDDR